jgi:hypothetical protein
MYKKIRSVNGNSNGSQASGGGLNKAESTITLKDLTATSPTSSSNGAHHHQPQQPTSATSESTVNGDESAPSNFTIESAVNGSDKVICEQPYEPVRPLAASIQTSSPSHHVPSPSPASPPSKLEPLEVESTEHTYKSIHHTATGHYRDMMVDENLENKQQNFVNEEDDVWRPW